MSGKMAWSTAATSDNQKKSVLIDGFNGLFYMVKSRPLVLDLGEVYQIVD
jgi:hypothetical protein